MTDSERRWRADYLSWLKWCELREAQGRTPNKRDASGKAKQARLAAPDASGAVVDFSAWKRRAHLGRQA